jgi:carbonic anhydrase/acetyltransferase-like protein (isoleucine patch superfamily)
VVGKDVPDFQLALGSPAKNVKDVREIKSRETGASHYPWPYRFDRGMPWQNKDFDAWEKNL